MDQEKISSETFYELVRSSETSSINKVSGKLIERMALYLTAVLGADGDSAKDCAQQAYEKVYVKIVNNSISDVDDIFGYLIRSARNEYLMKLRKEKFEVPSEHQYFSGIRGTTGEEVYQNLYSEEREKLLEYCIKQLKKSKQNFFIKVLKHINEQDKEVAEKLEMSHANFRTRKSRVIDALRDCVEKASKK